MIHDETSAHNALLNYWAERKITANGMVTRWKEEGVLDNLFEQLPHVHGIEADDIYAKVLLEKLLYDIAYLQLK